MDQVMQQRLMQHMLCASASNLIIREKRDYDTIKTCYCINECANGIKASFIGFLK